MMRKMKWFLLAVFVALGGVTLQAADVEQSSVLQGKVLTVVQPGAAVKEGDVIASVDSLVGAVPAVRASADGVVKEVLIHPGDTIEKQTVVAVIETKE